MFEKKDFDVVEDIGPGFITATINSLSIFLFEVAEKRFDNRIIVAVASTAHN